MYAVRVRAAVGYSGTPLTKKLGLDKARRISVLNAPPDYVRSLGVLASEQLEQGSDLIQFFAESRAVVQRMMPQLRQSIVPNGAIWISWPKKASKLQTDVDENFIRAVALANQLVDVKVCAVDATWSGLKLVIPLALRKA